MKKILLLASSVALMLAAVSCQKELNHLNGDVNVTFDVAAGDLATKADIADGTNVDALHWEIYKTDDLDAEKPLGEDTVIDNDGDKNFTVELKLLADQQYTIIFWAEKNGAGHYITSDLRNVSINTSKKIYANDESRAAFFRVYEFETENGEAVKETVELYRPFAQINLGATNLETSFNNVNDGKVLIDSTKMIVTSLATSFNTLEGKGKGTQPVTFVGAPTPNGAVDNTEQKLEVNELFYHWLGMNYVIVSGEDKDNVNVDISVFTNFGTVNHTVNSVPVKENYRTNLLGDFLTTGATFNVVVDEKFQIPDYIVPVPGENGNGSSAEYTISNVADLEWFQQQVNKEGNTFKGKTVKLMADIDLGGAEWTPITGFEGTFDGSKGTRAADDNYTISNFTVDVESLGGLFGSVKAKLLNVNIEDATVTSGHYAGALVGYIYGRVENCHANNVTVTAKPFKNAEGIYDDGNHAGGLVGYIAGSPMSYLINNSATNATVTAYRDLGGVVGSLAGTMTVEGNTSTDCTIIVDRVLDAAYNGDNKAENAGAVAGRNATGNITDEEFAQINTAAVGSENKETQTPSEDTTLATLLNTAGAVIELPAGEYSSIESMAAGVTIIGSEGTVINGSSSVGANAYIKNVKFRNTQTSGSDYETTALTGNLTDVVFDGCEFESQIAGTRWCYANGDVIFNDCTFGSDAALRGVHFDGGDGTLTFNNCTLLGFQAFASTIQKVTFNDCEFAAGGRADYNCVNMYNVFEYNNCTFIPDYHCDCAGNGVVADFNDCAYADGSSIFSLVRYDKDPNTCTIRFNGLRHVAEGVGLNDAEEYVLYSVDGMHWFENEVNENNNSFNDKIIKLAVDIDLANVAWTPVGQTGATQFMGTFDGQKHTISNLNIDATAQTGANYSSGLFGWLNAAVVKNVKIDGASVKGNHNVGVIAGYLETAGCTIENCHVAKAVVECHVANDDANGDKCGVIVGHAGNAGVVVKDCTASDSTVSAGRDAGQIAGAAKTENVTGCSATNVTVTANGEGTGANVRNEVIGRVL